MLIEILPASIAVLIPEISLLIVGYVVEKHYVSRVTCFTNALAVNIHLLTIGESGFWLGLYADIGLLLGIMGFLHYMAEESLGEWYYNISHLGYSSLFVGAIILYPHINWFSSAILGVGSFLPQLVVVLIVLFNLTLLDEADRLHYTLSRPVDVNDFIRDAPDVRLVYRDGSTSPFVGLDYWFKIK